MAGLIGLTWVFANVGEDSTFLYRGGFLVVSLLTAGVVAVAAHPGASFGRILGVSPVRWLGTRSYGIYLWHWPVFLLLRPGVDLPYDGLAADATALAVTGLVAEVSYRWVETPVRDGRFAALWRGAWQRGARGIAVVVAALTATALAVFGAGAALAAIPAVTAADYLGGLESIGAGALPTTSPTAAPAPTAPPSAAPDPPASPAPAVAPAPVPAADHRGWRFRPAGRPHGDLAGDAAGRRRRGDLAPGARTSTPGCLSTRPPAACRASS